MANLTPEQIAELISDTVERRDRAKMEYDRSVGALTILRILSSNIEIVEDTVERKDDNGGEGS